MSLTRDGTVQTDEVPSTLQRSPKQAQEILVNAIPNENRNAIRRAGVA